MREHLHRINACLTRDDDLRLPAAHAAFARVAGRRREGLILSVGGGPTRAAAGITNLNIIFDKNVDIVATAYQLPFRDASLAGVHCEAVLEHLEFPDAAVAEMHRVLRAGGLVFAATPFLQAYHGYPDHYQNFTLRGHVRLFERAGFAILEAGTCVGPTFAAVDLAANYAREMLPTRLLSRGVERLIRGAGRALRLADIRANVLPRSSQLCSTTYVLAEKGGR